MNNELYMYSNNDYRYYKSNELYHFGILGQKWGIRRYQNPDGSLTAAGREHYGYKNIEGVNFVSSNGRIYADSADIRRAGNELAKKTITINGQFKELTDLYAKENDRIRKDKTFVSKMATKVKSDTGLTKDNIDDPDLVYLYAYEIVQNDIGKQYSKELKNKEAELKKNFDDFFVSAKSYVDGLVKEKGTLSIDEAQAYKDSIYNTLESMSDSQWVYYLWNHQESAYLDSSVTYSDVVNTVVNEIMKN